VATHDRSADMSGLIAAAGWSEAEGEAT